jgi:hypothetical protein
MELTPRKHTKTIIATLIVLIGIAAFVVIYFFGDDIKAGLSGEGRPTPETTYTQAPEFYQPDPAWEETQPDIPGTMPAATAPPATQPPATVAPYTPPVTNPPAAPVITINVATAFPGATIKQDMGEHQWILTVSAGWSVTIPAGWIVNTDPNRFEVNPLPPDYRGLDGERLYPDTFMRAKMGGDIYVRFVG